MIVVGILTPGAPASDAASSHGAASHAASAIARRAAGTGARTEIVGIVPPGPSGDRQLADLAAAGVGHATVTRSGATAIEPADLELALRYLPDIRTIVLVAPPAPLLEIAAAASAWSGAMLVVVGPLDPEATEHLGAAAAEPILLEPPAHDPDTAFASVVAAIASRIDAGENPASAWRSTIASLAIDPA